MEKEYSAWAFVAGGWHYPLARYTTAETAMRKAVQAIKRPGKAERIIVTDGGDCTCFEWQRGLGVTFPTREQLKGATTP